MYKLQDKGDQCLPSAVSENEIPWVARSRVELSVPYETLGPEHVRIREHFGIVQARPTPVKRVNAVVY